jgi:hypothetical protein
MKRLSWLLILACMSLFGVACGNTDTGANATTTSGRADGVRARVTGSDNGGDPAKNSEGKAVVDAVSQVLNLSMGDKGACLSLLDGKHFCYGLGIPTSKKGLVEFAIDENKPTEFKKTKKGGKAISAEVIAGDRFFIAYSKLQKKFIQVGESKYLPLNTDPKVIEKNLKDEGIVDIKKAVQTSRPFACFIVDVKKDGKDIRDQLACAAGLEGMKHVMKAGQELFKPGSMKEGLLKVLDLGADVKNEGIDAVSCNMWNCALILKNSKEMRVFGAANRFQMPKPSFTAVALQGTEAMKFKAVSVGATDTDPDTRDRTTICGLTTDGKVVCSGDINDDAADRGPTPSKYEGVREMKIGGGKAIKEIAVGGMHLAAIAEDGSLYIIGKNDFGQTGMPAGTTVVKSADAKPIKNAQDKAVNFARVWAGEDTTCALTVDNVLLCTGRNEKTATKNGSFNPFSKEKTFFGFSPVRTFKAQK